MARPGDRIRLVAMPNDPLPIPAGTTGTVVEVRSAPWQIEVAWDIRRSLALLPDVDKFEVIGHTDLVAPSDGCPDCGNLAMDLLVWDDDGDEVTCSICQRRYHP